MTWPNSWSLQIGWDVAVVDFHGCGLQHGNGVRWRLHSGIHPHSQCWWHIPNDFWDPMDIHESSWHVHSLSSQVSWVAPEKGIPTKSASLPKWQLLQNFKLPSRRDAKDPESKALLLEAMNGALLKSIQRDPESLDGLFVFTWKIQTSNKSSRLFTSDFINNQNKPSDEINNWWFQIKMIENPMKLGIRIAGWFKIRSTIGTFDPVGHPGLIPPESGCPTSAPSWLTKLDYSQYDVLVGFWVDFDIWIFNWL